MSNSNDWIGNWNVECQIAMAGLGIGIWNFSVQKEDWEWNWNTENSMWNCIPIPEYKVDFPLCTQGRWTLDGRPATLQSTMFGVQNLS